MYHDDYDATIDDFIEKFSQNQNQCSNSRDFEVNFGCFLKSMTVSPNGNCAALGGNDGIFMVDLNDPWEFKSKFSQIHPMNDFITIKWCPKEINSILSANSMYCSLWKCTNSTWNVLRMFKAHSLRISDMNWSETDPNLFCTCSYDNQINIWDVRRLNDNSSSCSHKIKLYGNPPQHSKWNRIDRNKFATSHGGLVNIWDLRSFEKPMLQIEASTWGVLSIDWSYNNQDLLLTTSSSKSFKLWLLSSDIPTPIYGNSSVTKDLGCFMPFSNAVVVSLKGTGLVELFNIKRNIEPSFISTLGNKNGLISQFFFRAAVDVDFQILLWNANNSKMNVHYFTQSQIMECGYKEEDKQLFLQSNTIDTNTFISLEEEFDSLPPIPGVFIEKMDKIERVLLVTFQHGSIPPFLKVKFQFTPNYPSKIPVFIICENHTKSTDKNLIEDLKIHARNYIKKNENCIESCLKYISKKYQNESLDIILQGKNCSRELKAFSESDLRGNILGDNYELYIVSPGDTLPTIALKFNMDKSELRKINQIRHSGKLRNVVIVKKKKAEEKMKTDTTSNLEEEEWVPPSDPIAHDRYFSHAITTRDKASHGVISSKKFLKSLQPAVHKNIIKEKIQLILVPEFNSIKGLMTLTQNFFIFEPDLENPLVKKHGIFAYQIVIELPNIAECASIKPTNEQINDNMTYLVIAANVKKHSPKIYYFMSKKERVEKICSSLQISMSEKREKILVEYLNLESPPPESGSVVFKGAITLLKKHLSQGTKEEDQKTVIEDDDGKGEMIGESLLITNEEFKQIRNILPLRLQFKYWKRLYCTSVDGLSYITFFDRLYDSGPTVIFIKDSNSYVFGGFASEEWRIQDGFFGTGECFVFSVKPKFAYYKWTRANDFFMYCGKDGIGMGSGQNGKFAFFLDGEFNYGTSETSIVFLNRPLASLEEFTCNTVEIWGFI